MSNYEQLVEALRHTDFGDTCDHCERWGMCKDDDCIILQAAAAIEELQDTAQAQDKALKECARQLEKMVPKRGKWITHPEVKNIYGGVYIECPLCGEKYVVQYIADEKFCRNCGADMRAKMEVQE